MTQCVTVMADDQWEGDAGRTKCGPEGTSLSQSTDEQSPFVSVRFFSIQVRVLVPMLGKYWKQTTIYKFVSSTTNATIMLRSSLMDR